MRPRKPGRASALTVFFLFYLILFFVPLAVLFVPHAESHTGAQYKKKETKLNQKKKENLSLSPAKLDETRRNSAWNWNLKKKENGLQIETRRLENWKNLFADRPLICLLLLARLVETHCTYPRCVLNYLFMSAKPVPVCRNEIRFNEIKLRIPLERTSRVTNERVQHCVFLCLISVRLIEIR